MFKNVDLARMVRELWPGCRIVHGKPRQPQSRGSVERVNKEIKEVFRSLMRKAPNNNWVKFVPLVQHSISTTPHSTLEYQTPYRVLFGRDPVKGFRDLSVPDEIAQDIISEELIR